MIRPKRGAFTLVELLVVITVIAIMIVLLMPAFSSAYQFAQMTTCQKHLKTIWDAMGTYRSDKGTTLFATGRGWTGLILPYVERNLEVYHCPLVKARLGSNTGGTITSTTTPTHGTTTSTSGIGSGGGIGTSTGNQRPTSVDIAIEMYPRNFNGDMIWSMSVDSVWVKKNFYVQNGTGSIAAAELPGSTFSVGANQVMYCFEDQGYHGGGDMDYNDVTLLVTYDPYGTPTDVQIKTPQSAADFDLVVGETKVHDIKKHIDETIHINVQDSQGSSSTGTGGNAAGGPATPTQGLTITVTYAPSDYGLSRGYYTDTAGRDAPSIDSKLFMVLDYPQPLVDYTDFNQSSGSATSDSSWDKFFIDTATNPNALKNWLQNFGPTCGTDWEQYQALRHFTKANVLFCDGHIESLGGDELGGETDVRWQYGGGPGIDQRTVAGR